MSAIMADFMVKVERLHLLLSKDAVRKEVENSDRNANDHWHHLQVPFRLNEIQKQVLARARDETL